MDLEELGTLREHEEQSPTHLIQVKKELNSCGSRG